MIPRTSVLILALLILLPGCPGDEPVDESVSSAGPFRVRVRVIDGDTDLPLAGINVYLLLERKIHGRGLTDAEGRHDFGYVAAGPYVVTGGRDFRRYVRGVREIDLAEDTDVELRIRKHEGFKIRVEMPEGAPYPEVIRVVYRTKAGRTARCSTSLWTIRASGTPGRSSPGSTR